MGTTTEPGDGLPHPEPRPPPSESTVSKIPNILPHERVFPIQIGSELFKLSGASLSSDAPSYFSQYFLCQIHRAEAAGDDPNTAVKTLYIDRDIDVFRDIVQHLQGYHIAPRDGTHFVRLFADAHFYSLPKLISQLSHESIFISIGHREFQVPRDIFDDPGNTPNYFTLGFGAFFSRPEDLFPGLDKENLIRPPSIIPPSVPNRSADTFAELLRLLRGYPVNVRDERHRQELLRDARYFHFKGLEQRLIAHTISYNQVRQREDMVLRLDNVQKSGLAVASSRDDEPNMSWVTYSRPYIVEPPRDLVLEIGGHSHQVHFAADGAARAEFFQETKARLTRLFEVIAARLNLRSTTPLGLLMGSGGADSQPATPGSTPLSDDLVRVQIDADSAVLLDGREYRPPAAAMAGTRTSNGTEHDHHQSASHPSPKDEHQSNNNLHTRKRRRTDNDDNLSDVPGPYKQEQYHDVQAPGQSWSIKTGQWRLRIEPTKGGKRTMECVLVAVKLDAVTGEFGRNMARSFLGE